MSERKINLEEILFKHLSKAREMFPNENWYSDEEIKNSPEFVFFINAMKEACFQTLELGAENADLSYCENEWEVPEGTINTGDSQYGYHYIDKQSILNTIKQIE